MPSFQESVDEYRRQLAKGTIQQAYRGLMAYMMDLRTHFATKYPDCSVSGSIYYGYMDMTYFAFSPESLKRRNLKIAVVFLHETCRFQAWLAGANKQVQTKYWKLFRESDWRKYPLVPTTKGVDAIMEYTVVDQPDFSDLDDLTEQIERGTLQFTEDVEGFLSGH